MDSKYVLLEQISLHHIQAPRQRSLGVSFHFSWKLICKEYLRWIVTWIPWFIRSLFHMEKRVGMKVWCRKGQIEKWRRIWFYSYRIAFRDDPFSPLHYGRKLFQQYCVDASVRTEASRLNYHRNNQQKLPTELYFGLADHLQNETIEPRVQMQLGRPKILASSFTSGPRYKKQSYEDAMAMVTEYGKPNFFVTYTCNPTHPDIDKNLGNNPRGNAHRKNWLPQVVAAVFKLHLDALKKDLKNAFGKQFANIHVIEYQKHGLPHAHILIWLVNDNVRTVEDLDSSISAEIPDPAVIPRLHELVSRCMMHGPCGLAHTNALHVWRMGDVQRSYQKTSRKKLLWNLMVALCTNVKITVGLWWRMAYH